MAEQRCKCGRVADTVEQESGKRECLACALRLPPGSFDKLPLIAWNRATVPGRADIIGVRELENGQKEYLIHNEALCAPYYLATSASTDRQATPECSICGHPQHDTVCNRAMWTSSCDCPGEKWAAAWAEYARANAEAAKERDRLRMVEVSHE